MSHALLRDAQGELSARFALLEQQVNVVYEEVPFGSHCVAQDGTYQRVNALELAWLGYPLEDLIGKRRPTEFLTPESLEKFEKHSHSYGIHGFADLELDLVGRDGVARPILMSSSGFLDFEGRARTNRTVSFDMTESRDRQNRLNIAAIGFESLSGICVTDSQGMVLRVNRAFTTLTGYSQDDVQGKTMHLLSSGHHDAAFYRAMWSAITTRGSWQGEIYNRRKDGQIYTEWLSITATLNAEGAVSHYVGSFFDITASKATQAEISHMAFFDTLTQLPNRRLMVDRLGHALAAASRTGVRGAVLFVDLDNFKLVNDTRGHAAGDLLLIEVARRLRTAVREGDSVARIGGDEFIVLLESLGTDHVEAATYAKRVAENVLDVLAVGYKIASDEFHCTASVGISMYGSAESASDLLQHADLAMYEAKKAGRNALRFFDQTMQTAVSARVTLEQDLRRAMGLDQFELYYQPQVNQQGVIIGAEALLRWHCGDKGLVSPSDFIPLAEESNLILPIGNWVLRAACAQLKAWEAHPLACKLQLAVNVSARQFLQTGFVAQVQEILAASAINPARIKLEITESMVLDVEGAVLKMNALRAAGVSFSMDDFGTGYSSLSSLTKLPLDQLKIDQSFVHNMDARPSDAVIVQTIIGMANNLGLQAIAEGVETRAQQASLKAYGCNLLQGFLFGRPVPVRAFEAMLFAQPVL